MSARHTPGPWTTEEAPHRAWIAAVGNNLGDPDIWTERQFKDGESYEFGDKEADARLIAAAPELLAALRAFIEPYSGQPRLDFSIEHRARIDAARAAIAKAEGAAK